MWFELKSVGSSWTVGHEEFFGGYYYFLIKVLSLQLCPVRKLEYFATKKSSFYYKPKGVDSHTYNGDVKENFTINIIDKRFTCAV